jgi:hypothetical protein
MPYEPFIDDPEHIREVEGQRFVVFRPTGVVNDCHRELQDVLRRRLSGLPVSFPARGHVTLAGFVAGTQLESVQELLSTWTRGVPPLRVQVQGARSFPSPFQILYLEVLKTPALIRALRSLRRLAEERGLPIDTVIPVEAWVFHMSLAYCSRLTATQWDSIARFSETQHLVTASCMQETVEIAAFDDGREHSAGTYALPREAVVSSSEHAGIASVLLRSSPLGDPCD